MKKRIAGILTIAFFAASSIFSPCNAETVRARVADHRINVNGHIVFNRLIEYPMMEYKDVTYYPMTTDNLEVMGLGMQWDPATGVNIYKDGVVRDFVMSEINKGLHNTNSAVRMEVADFNIEVNGNVIDNAAEEYPILFKDNIVYFPLTWRYVTGEFEGTIIWNDEYGLSIYNYENSNYTKNQVYMQNQKQYLQDALARYETALEMYESNRQRYSEIEDSLQEASRAAKESMEIIEKTKSDYYESLGKEIENSSKEVIAGADMGISDIKDETQSSDLTQKSYGYGTAYELERILESGKYLQFDDKSLWEVNIIEDDDSQMWESGSEVILLESENEEYPYKILNAEMDKSVEAKLLSQ